MKVVTNTELIESRAKWGRRIAPLTMLFLIGGLITNFLSINQPNLFRPTMVLLALGFVSAIVSSHLVNNWVKEPRADQTLSQLLKKFGNDYTLFNYTSPISHALIAPNALYAIVVKNHDGQITVNGHRVSKKFTWRRVFRLLADEGIGAPITEAEKQARKLRSFLDKHLNSEDIPDIQPLLLFSNKNLELVVNEPAIPVLSTQDFKNFIREQGKNRNVSATQRKELTQILDMKPGKS